MFTPILDSKETHDESYRFRLAIEPQALLENSFELDQEAARACEAKHRQILDGTVRDVSAIELFEMNAEFHELLARSSGNRFFLQAIQQQNRLRRFVNYHWTYGADRVIATCREHMAILEAIQNGDRTWAANLLRRHIEISGSINPYEGALDGDQKPQHVISLPQARR
jgi:DNA-binding GntR family transcriptional regulator